MKEVSAGLILISCSGLLILLGLFRKKNNFIDLRSVCINHFKIFKNARMQYFTFYVLPLFMAIGISCIYTADITMYQNIVVAISIFVSMLLAMLSILASKDISKYSDAHQEKIKNVLRETNNTIVFCTFVSIVIIVVSLIMIAISSTEMQMLKKIVASGVYYLIQVLLLNILLVVKRMGKLI